MRYHKCAKKSKREKNGRKLSLNQLSRRQRRQNVPSLVNCFNWKNLELPHLTRLFFLIASVFKNMSSKDCFNFWETSKLPKALEHLVYRAKSFKGRGGTHDTVTPSEKITRLKLWDQRARGRKPRQANSFRKCWTTTASSTTFEGNTS